MLYGHSKKVVDKKYKLLELRDVTFALPPEALRDLGTFLSKCADELEQSLTLTWGWHRHPDKNYPSLLKALKQKLLTVSLPKKFRPKDIVKPKRVAD